MGMLTPFALEDLIITRPELQAGLTDVIPPGEVPTHYINRYLAEHEVKCAFCDKHTPHLRGFTAKMGDGRTALCGIDCAAKYFGKEVADKFEEQLERQIELAARRRLVSKTVEGVPEALTLLTDELLEEEVSAAQAVAALYDAFKATKVVSRFNDAGHFERTVDKAKWVERAGSNGTMKSVKVFESVVVGRVEHAIILRKAEYPPQRLNGARSELKVLAGIDLQREWSPQVIDRLAQKRAAIIADIRRGVAFLNLARKFFTRENIKTLNSLIEVFDVHIERVALHICEGGFDLGITRDTYWSAASTATDRTNFYFVPDFISIPTEEELLAPLK